MNYRYVAGLWHRLMRGLGYERYGAQGGDFGAGVATFMALDNPEPMIGVHLSNLEIPPYTGPGSRQLSEAERTYLERSEAWWRLTTLTIYWATQTITSSMRDYFDNRWFGVTLGPQDFVHVPTGIAAFDNRFVPEGTPPREWAERLYSVRQWTPMPSGGHFAPR